MTLLRLSAWGFGHLKVSYYCLITTSCPSCVANSLPALPVVFSSPRKTAFAYTALPRFMSMSASAFDAKYGNILMSRS